MTEGDPPNSPEDLQRLKQAADPDALVLLPHGGHLGYTRTTWIKGDVGSTLGSP